MTISRNKKAMAGAAFGMTAAASIVPAFIAPASAATVAATGGTATVNNHSNGDKVSSGDTVNFSVKGISIPATAQANDTFELSIPAGLAVNLATPISLTAADGSVVGTATRGDNPQSLKVTLSDYVSSHQNVTASVTFNALVTPNDTEAAAWPKDTAKEMTVSVSGQALDTGVSLNRVVNKPGAQDAIVQTDKNDEPSMDYLQARVTKDNSLYDGFKGTPGPYTQTLTAPDGAVFDCDYNASLQVTGYNYDDAASSGLTAVGTAPVKVVSCTDTTLKIEVPVVNGANGPADFQEWRPLLKLTPEAYAAKQTSFPGGHSTTTSAVGTVEQDSTGIYVYTGGAGDGSEFAPKISTIAYIDDANPAAPTGKTADGQDSDANSAPGVNAKAGDQTVSVTVKNDGYGTLTNVKVTDGSGKEVGTIASLAPGESKTITTTVNVADAKAYTDTFTATATNASGPATASDPVNANVQAAVVAPQAANDTFTTDYNKPATIDATKNDTLGQPSDSWKSIVLDGAAADGSVTTDQGKWTVDGVNAIFTPKDGFSGAVTPLGYTATDSNGNTAKATISGNVGAKPEDPKPAGDPKATNDTFTTTCDKAVTFNPLANDVLVDGTTWVSISFGGKDTLTVDAGTFQVNADKTVTFTPKAGVCGNVPEVTYTATDNTGKTTDGKITGTVDPLPEVKKPQANPDETKTDYNKPVTIDPRTNDTKGQDGDSWTKVEVGTTDKGTVVVNPDGTVTFTPNDGVTGKVEIPYTVTDNHGNTTSSTITVTVGEKPADPKPEVKKPQANPDETKTDYNKPVTIDPRTNDTKGQDTDKWVKVEVGTTDKGTAVVNPDGTVTFTPNDGVTGKVEIPYTVTDSNGNTTSSTITVTVGDKPADPKPEVKKPSAADDSTKTKPEVPVTVDVSTNDTKGQDKDSWTKVEVGTTDKGTVTVDGTKVTFTPNKGVTGKVELPYTITDSNGNTAQAKIIIDVEKPADTTKPADPKPNTDKPVTEKPATEKPATPGPVIQTDMVGGGDDSALASAAGLVSMLGLGGVAMVGRRRK